MDTRDGKIYRREDIEIMSPDDLKYMRKMGHHPTTVQRARGKVGRNDFCPCGSGRKFKKCCVGKST